MGCPRVLLADDLPQIRERLTELLRCDFDIVATAQNGQQAVEAASTLDPDVIVLDISMPILNGIQVASHLHELGCRTKIVFTTVHEDPDYVEAAFSVGATAYVFKSCLATDLVPAVHRALQGYKFISLRNRSTLREDPQTGHLNSRLALKRA
jgi:DNA-binding NarL/FixJ family response regulator